MSKPHSRHNLFGHSPKELQSQNMRGRPMNLKPFCDCKDCPCEDCPDILQRLAITFSNETCYFGKKSLEKRRDTDFPSNKTFADQSSERRCNDMLKSRSILPSKSSKAECICRKNKKISINK